MWAAQGLESRLQVTGNKDEARAFERNLKTPNLKTLPEDEVTVSEFLRMPSGCNSTLPILERAVDQTGFWATREKVRS